MGQVTHPDDWNDTPPLPWPYPVPFLCGACGRKIEEHMTRHEHAETITYEWRGCPANLQ